MKISSILTAVAAVALAPLAVAQAPANCAAGAGGANAATLNGLTISSTIKRTTVTGGHRIVQSIRVTNNAATTATGLGLGTRFTTTGATFLKGSAKVTGGSKLTMAQGAAAGAFTPVTGGATAFTIPAGKTLKATVSWRAVSCPAVGAPPFPWGPAAVGILADGAAPNFAGMTGCMLTSTPAAGTPITINRRKTC